MFSVASLASSFLFAQPTTTTEYPVPPIESISTTTAKQLITGAAKHYGANSTQLYNTLKCESQDFKNKQSGYFKNGIQEDSWGIAQIHLPDHPNITKEQALDPYFSIDWAAQEFAAGREWQWTCYTLIYKKRPDSG